MKKCLVLVLVLALALTMALPAFADTTIMDNNFADEDDYNAFLAYAWCDGDNQASFSEESHTDDGSGSIEMVAAGPCHTTAIFAAEVGKTYTISAWINNKSGSTGMYGLAINTPFHSAWAGHPSGTFDPNGFGQLTADKTWQYIEFDFTPADENLNTVPEGGETEFGGLAEGTRYTYVSFVVWGAGNLVFDEVKIVEKNPSTGDASMIVVAVIAVALAAAVVFTKKRSFAK